jgi:transposase-like protein
MAYTSNLRRSAARRSPYVERPNANRYPALVAQIAVATARPCECPKCHSRETVLAWAAAYINRESYFCPDCEHVWDVQRCSQPTEVET